VIVASSSARSPERPTKTRRWSAATIAYLRLEVAIGRAHGVAELAGEALHRQGRHALGAEDGLGGVEDSLERLLASNGPERRRRLDVNHAYKINDVYCVVKASSI